MNGVFITGSNTNVGKTIVGIEIIKFLSKTRSVKARKPVETNCQIVNGNYLPRDAEALNNACFKQEPLNKVCPFCFELEASPEDASLDVGTPISLDQLSDACHTGVEGSFVVIEGAGGLYSPIADGALNSDLAIQLKVPIVIVIRDELGAISQALMSIEAAKKNNLEVSCVILNEIIPNSLSNKKGLIKYTNTPVISFSKKRMQGFYSDIEGLF